MRSVFAILLLTLGYTCFAKKADTESLPTAITAFDKALVNRDTVALKELLSDDLSYGHSNGWIETKRELISDLFNGKLIYKRILAEAPQWKAEGSTASARFTVDIDCVMDGKPLSFKLKVLQVWVWKNKHWELFARQSVPIAKDK